MDPRDLVFARLAGGDPWQIGVLGAFEELFQHPHTVGTLRMVGTGIVETKTGIDDEAGRTHAAFIPSAMYPRQYPWRLQSFRANVRCMFGMGPSELIVILVIALLVLGPQRLPELARSLGKAIGEFKRATGDIQSELDNARVMLEEETRAAAREQQNKKGRGFPDAATPQTPQAAPAETTVARQASAETSQPEPGAQTASANAEEAAKNA